MAVKWWSEVWVKIKNGMH